MKDWKWKLCALVALAGLIVWIQMIQAKSDERYRLLLDRQDRIDALVECLPGMVAVEIERHHRRMIVYLESRDD